MSAASPSVPDSPEAILDLDELPKLPPARQRSFQAVLVVQALNAFNDNFVKILLVAFAGVAAKDTELGTSMQLYLGAIFSLPYILFAPVAGWLSDRCSKQRVIFWMQVAQLAIFLLFLGSMALHQAQLSLALSLGCFFLLAAQAAFFSPAKMGIAKELVGSRRLGAASGMLQLTNFMGILGGMAVAGLWFGARLKSGLDPWSAAWLPMLIVTLGSLAPIIGSLLIVRTPEHTGVKFHHAVWWEHFIHLKLLFSQRPLKLAALGITYFWFMSNAVGAILVTLSKEMHPGDDAAAAQAMSMMPAMLGIGVMGGSLISSLICRRRIELGLVPLSGFGLALSLFWSGLMPVSPWIYLGLVAVGVAGGAFMAPLYAFVQDRARPEERARILSAINLMDCVGAVVANLVLVKGMLHLGIPSHWQLLVLVPLSICSALFITRLLPRSLLFIVAKAISRSIYRLRSNHEERMPEKGPLLVLGNHVSYVDALLLGSSCPRETRFVMLESLYKMKSVQWVFKVFGTVPISPTKAKDAIRTVAEALKEQGAVALYPEGQITRTGFLNEVQKGYELMARMGGEARVQPVWTDGVWGSIFSFERGRFFKKTPRNLRYPVTVWFGEPLEARAATTARVTEAFLALSAEAFAARPTVKKNLRLKLASGAPLDPKSTRMAHLNALRIFDTSLLHHVTVVLCLLPKDHPVALTFGLAVPALRPVPVCWSVSELPAAAASTVLVVCDAAAPAPEIPAASVFTLAAVEAAAPVAGSGTARNLCFDAVTGAILSLSVPDPVMPKGEEGLQVGGKPGSLGHLMPGLSLRRTDDGLVIGGLMPDSGVTVTLSKAIMDADGFIFPPAEPLAA